VATQDEEKTRPTTSAEEWGLAYEGLGMSADDSENVVKEFTGIWPLKPDADMVAFTKALGPGGWIDPPGESFSENMMKLGLIRAARWFVAKTAYFPEYDNDGYTLVFVSQFDNTLEKYFDDFVLNGKPNLEAVWGTCIGCPTGPDATAHDIVEYIARGQIKTLAVFDVVPGLSIPQIYKAVDWYEKAQKFQRAVAQGDDPLEEKVDAFLQELAEPYEPVTAGAAIDLDVGSELQYEETKNQRGG
jgi:hypothetical protein